MNEPNVFLWGASVAYGMLWAGLMARRRKRIHVWWMGLAIGLDVLVVGGLELQRHAVETAVGGEMSSMLRFHVWVSTLAVVCYLAIVPLGVFRYRGASARVAEWHGRFGRTAMAFRSLGFFSMLAFAGLAPSITVALVAIPLALATLGWSLYPDGRAQLIPRIPAISTLIHPAGSTQRR